MLSGNASVEATFTRADFLFNDCHVATLKVFRQNVHGGGLPCRFTREKAEKLWSWSSSQKHQKSELEDLKIAYPDPRLPWNELTTGEQESARPVLVPDTKLAARNVYIDIDSQRYTVNAAELISKSIP
jgi:hypothetical protein